MREGQINIFCFIWPLCILKGKMPFKMHKIIFFPEKKICVPTLPKIFRPITRNMLIFLFGLTKSNDNAMPSVTLEPSSPRSQVKHSTTEPPHFSTSQFTRNEPLHDETKTCVSCKESDQPGHLPSLTSLGSLHEQNMSPELPIECTYKTCPTDMISMPMRVLDALLVLLVLLWVSSYMGNSVARTLKKLRTSKGRLQDLALIIFNCAPFQIGTSLTGKNLLSEGANSFLYEQFPIVWKILLSHKVTYLECYYCSYARA